MPKNDDSNIVSDLPEDWERCHAFMEKKKRFCRQQRASDSSYCGNHQHLATTINTKRKRVPCPLDSSHLVFEDSIEKHVLVCPKATKQKDQERQFFYQSNINAGGHGMLVESARSIDLTRAKRLAQRIVSVHVQIFGGGTSFAGINEATELLDLSEPEMTKGLPEAIAVHRIRSGGYRHVLQQASLLGHLRRIGAYQTTTKRRRLIELGAGRGMSGLIMAAASSGSGVTTDLILVERSGSRGKADKILRTFTTKETTYPFDLKSVSWKRVQCDIAHVDLVSLLNHHPRYNDAHQMSEDSTDELVVVAKHLCGVGSDLALKSLYPIRSRVTACIFATCCHGVCSWNGYVGRDYLRKAVQTEELPFGEAEFDLVRKWAGAVVMEPTIDGSDDDEGDDNRHYTSPGNDKNDLLKSVSITAVADGLDCGTRGLSRACQRLIDYGRREYIHQILGNASDLNVEMLRYTPDEITPQNTALIGYRKSLSPLSSGVKRTANSMSESI
ncbi:tRNA:m4X modification enzyme [Fistulifera solaris]|uniref:tRNA:m(4)X modification enzyme TRM13 n=1 Tax=Fistulifera solaris TaxID=1519565 RepID=A0A1Z5K415_FISSO|nr:tRNA:m4X modification enzyme [Fistulifera solaris]|eukprot:GAX20912.1 tRNA:m4X modification enzyme [Fistulifera solaris]